MDAIILYVSKIYIYILRIPKIVKSTQSAREMARTVFLSGFLPRAIPIVLPVVIVAGR